MSVEQNIKELKQANKNLMTYKEKCASYTEKIADEITEDLCQFIFDEIDDSVAAMIIVEEKCIVQVYPKNIHISFYDYEIPLNVINRLQEESIQARRCTILPTPDGNEIDIWFAI